MVITHLTDNGSTWSNDLTSLPYTTFNATLTGNTLVADGTTLTKVVP